MMKMRLLLLSALLLFLATVTLGDTDPQLLECKRQCQVQHKIWEDLRLACLRDCEMYYQERQQKECPEAGGGGGGGGGTRIDPWEQYQGCLKDCRREEEGWPRQLQCQNQCAGKLREQEQEGGKKNIFNQLEREAKQLEGGSYA